MPVPRIFPFYMGKYFHATGVVSGLDIEFRHILEENYSSL